MAVVNIPRPEDRGASQTLISEAAALVARRWREFPPDFFSALYERAAPDDLERYQPEELAAIGEQAWTFLAERKPGTAKIAFTPARLTPDIAVLEILNDDMPFLVDSVLGELSERAVDVRLLVHPVFTVERDEAGRLTAFRGVRKGEGRRESFIHVHVRGIEDAAQRADIVHALEDVLADVRVSVQDWRAMLARVQEVTADLKTTTTPLPADEIAEAIQFLQWIAADNFHPARRPQLRLQRQRARARTEVRDRARTVAVARDAAVAPRQPARHHHAGNPRVPARAETAHYDQSRGAFARPPPRPSGLYRGEALRPRRQPGRRMRVLRASHLDRLHPLGARYSLSAAQDR